MNQTIAKFIFKAGAKWRNPDLFKEFNALKKSDFWTRAQYQSLQQKKLTDLLNWHRQSAYYGAIIGEFDDPFQALSKIPAITKADLLQNISAMQRYDAVGKTFLAETSGSTGDPFQFKKNLEWDTANRASFLRGYSWYNVEPWQRNGYFWGYTFSGAARYKTAFLDSLQNRFRVFSYNKTELKHFLAQMKDAVYIHGYSSMIYEIAQMAAEMGYSPNDFPNLKMIKGTSEKIYPYYHEPVKKAFGHKIISEYGSAEGGIHAFECPKGHMHINEENVIIEEIDGEAIVTNLNAFSLPVIRYKIGDAIKISDSNVCTCGRNSRVILEVEGRVGKKIIGRNQTFPSLTLYYIFKNISLKHGADIQYQGYQSEAGRLELRVTKNLSSSERKWINEQCENYFADDMEVSIKENQNIHDKKGKLKDFISDLVRN